MKAMLEPMIAANKTHAPVRPDAGFSRLLCMPGGYFGTHSSGLAYFGGPAVIKTFG